MASYIPVTEQPHSSTEEEDEHNPTFPPSRQSFLSAVVPPQLSKALSEKVIFNAEDDDDDSSESERESDELDEKVRLVEDGILLQDEDTHWTERKAARSRVSMPPPHRGHNARLLTALLPLLSFQRYRILLLLPLSLAGILILTFLASHIFRGRHSYHGAGRKPISFDHIANGTFYPSRVELAWLGEAGDGVYSFRAGDGSILLHDVDKNETRTLVRGEDIKDPQGNKINWNRFRVSADLKYILFDSDYVKQWRHSSHANFYVHTLSSSPGTTFPLHPLSSPPHIALALFSPKNHHIAYVHANDLYVHSTPPEMGSNARAIRITDDGAPTQFNGVPDWVYEEEVFASDTALWWSPDASKLAFLSFDEERVPEYDFPIYNPSVWGPGAEAYPKNTVMRYPKPGFPNPLVTLRVFNLNHFLTQIGTDLASSSSVDPRVKSSLNLLTFENPFPATAMLITEVTWIGKDELMVKMTDRSQGIERIAWFEVGDDMAGGTLVGKTAREKNWMRDDGGWVEPGSKVTGVSTAILLHSHAHPSSDILAKEEDHPAGYLDVVPNSKGFNHIAYFSPPSTATPVFLTDGEWEVDGGLQAVDVEKGLVYFIAANPSIERHLYSVPLPTKSSFAEIQGGNIPPPPTPLTDTSVRGYHSASFSPFGGFYVLNYGGPKAPWQKLIKVDDKDFSEILSDNSNLEKTETDFVQVVNNYTTVTANGIEMNVQELRPPNLDLSGRTKYPVLFQVYGGPASQKVSTSYYRDWHYYLVSTYNYVVVTVDGRGTGYKGRGFRMPIRNQLGVLEAEDVVNAAKVYRDMPWVDEKRIGIWGWSYGGFLTCKVVETNSSVFTLAMAVAPVTDWRYYDSIYTERYMSVLDVNQQGYINSSITHMEGFKHLDFALAHGSGDDNGEDEPSWVTWQTKSLRTYVLAVHFLNSAALLDRLTWAGVRDWRFRMFTDSDHSMGMRGAYWELMPWLSSFLYEKWGEGGTTKQRWKHTKVHDTD